jgi:hypothetical protein
VLLSHLQLNSDDLIVFSKLKFLTIQLCDKAFDAPFTQAFWEMIKSTTNISVLDLDWRREQNQNMVTDALEENGSIVDGGLYAGLYSRFFERNKKNQETTMTNVLHLLAIRRHRSLHANVPREVFYMLGRFLWNTRCDTKAHEWNQ